MTPGDGEAALDEAGQLLSRRVGLRLDPAIRGRLARAVRDEALRSGLDERAYVARLEQDPELLQALLNRVTVQETSFFRDAGQFDALATHILPSLQEQGVTVRIWSAGCSNGQEPYSLAMTLVESGIPDWQVIASDLSTRALDRTLAGRYREGELRGLSPERRERFLVPSDDDAQVVPELRSRVRVLRHNLAVDPPPFEPGACQIVFCRNVLIYFRHDDVVAVLDRIGAHLPADGHLFVGYSESLWQVSGRFQLARIGEAFVYHPVSASPGVRRPAAPSSARPTRPAPAAPPPAPPAPAPSAPPPAAGPSREPRPAPEPTSTELMADGEAALGRGDHVAAIAAFRKAVFLDGDHPLAHLNLGFALEGAGALPAARRSFAAARRAIERCDTGAVEMLLEGYHLDDLVGLLDRKIADR